MTPAEPALPVPSLQESKDGEEEDGPKLLSKKEKEKLKKERDKVGLSRSK